MKKIIILVMTLVAIMGVNAQSYALHFNSTDSPVVAPGDTVVYTITENDYLFERAYINIYIDNVTDSDLMTDNTIRVTEGPAGLEYEICAGGFCPQQGPYNLVPGPNPLMPLTIEPLTAGMEGNVAIFEITVGESPRMDNGVTIYLKVVFPGENLGISGVNRTAEKVYPNPTTGKVTVGDREYDLGGRPAGVYYLPAKQGSARVIKL